MIKMKTAHDADGRGIVVSLPPRVEAALNELNSALEEWKYDDSTDHNLAVDLNCFLGGISRSCSEFKSSVGAKLPLQKGCPKYIELKKKGMI